MKPILSATWKGIRLVGRVAGATGRATIALIGICGVVAAVANYALTQGTGTNFGSIVVSSVHYAQGLVCDFVTPAQCVNVKPASTAAVAADLSLVTNESPNSLLSLASLAPQPYLPATTPTTNTYTTGVTSPINGDLHGAWYSDISAWAGTQLGAPSNFGTTPGAVVAPPINASLFYGTTAAVGDPCHTQAKSFLPITATTSLVKVIATGVSAKKLYICQLLLTVTAADNVAVFEATTGSTCATSPVAVYGAGTTVATAANGFPFPANGGISLGNGESMVGQTTVNNNDLCIGTSAATPLTGGITYVTQ